jgi:hypothetical protein
MRTRVAGCKLQVASWESVLKLKVVANCGLQVASRRLERVKGDPGESGASAEFAF